MIVLALEGALGSFSAALAIGGEIRAATQHEGNVALEAGLGMVRDVLHEAQLNPTQLDRLATGVGPGGFTGLRITIAYAKALGLAWQLPLAGVSSFDILEYGHRSERALGIVEGRRGIISARYRSPSGSRRGSGATADVLDEVLAAAERGPLPVFGAPEDVISALAERGFIVERRVPLVAPAAAALALAAGHVRAFDSVHEVRADYGEAPAAKIPTFTRTGEAP